MMSLPSMAARETGIGLKPTLTWPPARSVIKGLEPLYGICWTATPACCANKTDARWLTVPTPGVPTWNAGFEFFIIAIKSATERTCKLGWTRSSAGAEAIRPIGAKSLRGS